jgi:hypothetical protein
VRSIQALIVNTFSYNRSFKHDQSTAQGAGSRHAALRRAATRPVSIVECNSTLIASRGCAGATAAAHTYSAAEAQLRSKPRSTRYPVWRRGRRVAPPHPGLDGAATSSALQPNPPCRHPRAETPAPHRAPPRAILQVPRALNPSNPIPNQHHSNHPADSSPAAPSSCHHRP